MATQKSDYHSAVGDIVITLDKEGNIKSVSHGEMKFEKPLQNLEKEPFAMGELAGIKTFHLLTFRDPRRKTMMTYIHAPNCWIYGGP